MFRAIILIIHESHIPRIDGGNFLLFFAWRYGLTITPNPVRFNMDDICLVEVLYDTIFRVERMFAIFANLYFTRNFPPAK